MKLNKFTLSLLLTIFSVTPNVSAEILNVNLDDCINLALKNNRSIEQSEASRENATWTLKRYRRVTGPSLSWTSNVNKIGGNDYVTRRNSLHVDFDYEFANTLRLTYPLYTGGRNENNITSAQFNLNSADMTLENTKQQVIYNVTAAYYNVLRNKNLVQVKENTINLLQEHLNQANQKFEIGVVAGSDILASKVQIANAQQSLVSSQNDYDNAIATLNNLMGLPVSTDLTIDDDLKYQIYAVNFEDCLGYALEHRPDFIAANFAVQKAEKDISVVKAGKNPQLNAVVSKVFNGESAFKDNHNDNWAAGVSMSWSVFDNNVISAQVHESEANLKRLKSICEQTKQQVELDVRQAFNNLKAAEKNIQTTQAAVNQAEEEYRISLVKYDEGVGTNLEVMDSQEKLTEVQTNFYTALYNYNTSKAQLDKAMGVPVDIDTLQYNLAVQEGKSESDALANSLLNRNQNK